MWGISWYEIDLPGQESEDTSITDDMREDLLEHSVIFHLTKLSNFQRKVNSAAAEIALTEPKLVRKGN